MLLMMAAGTTMAQEVREISGVVTDNTGSPIAGASVTVPGTSATTTTDSDGRYTISVPEGSDIAVAYIGYDTTIQAVEDNTVVNVTMFEEFTDLEDLIVIGYGSVKKSTLTSAVTRIGEDGIGNRPIARAEQLLQGQIAGATVRNISGEPGHDLQVRVRGAASINASSDPLYVVDGVPMDGIATVIPSDILSIEVLKDAAAAAIYGSRGSNGVIMITTKQGKSIKPMVYASAQAGVQSLDKKLDVMSATEWMAFMTKSHEAGAIKNADERWKPYLDGTAPTEELSLLDWQDESFRNATYQNYDVSISGSTESVNYYFSGNYMKQEGILLNTDYRRAAFRAKIEAVVNPYITVGLNLAPSLITANNAGLADGKDNMIHQIVSSAPVSEPGVGYDTNVNGNGRYAWGGGQYSPTFVLNNSTNRSDCVSIVGSGFVRVTPIEDLTIEMSGAMTYADSDNSGYTPGSTKGNTEDGAASTGYHNTSRTWTTLLQVIANYRKTFGSNNVAIMLGGSKERTSIGFSTQQAFSGFANDLVTGSFDSSSSANVTANRVNERTPNNLASFFGRVQYDYDERYMLSASLRYDGGSVFGADNKWGVFPAVSAGWMISNENFWESASSWWNLFKLRLSYGVTGNNKISDTAAYASLSNVSYGGKPAFSVNSRANDDLGWEKTHSTNVAIDLGFAQNRFQVSADWYVKNTVDLLYQMPVLGSTGFSTNWANAGEIKNYGLDIEVNTVNISNDNFTWKTQLNAGWNRGEVMSIGTDDAPVYSGFDGLGNGNNTSNILTVGQPINAFYTYEAIGVWESQEQIDAYAAQCGVTELTHNGAAFKPGDIRYRDVNGDGKIEADADRVIMGQPTPKWVFGMTNSFVWGNWDASVLVTAQTGGKIMSTLGRAIDRPMGSAGVTSNMLSNWANAWTAEDAVGDGSTPYVGSTITGAQVDSRWIYKSDFFSIKNVTLGYTLPLSTDAIQSARAYVSCENLFRADSYDGGFSPEAANGSAAAPGGSSATGLDYGSYPMARTITLGLNITF